MADHPITPPPELVQKWFDQAELATNRIHCIATRAAGWGYEQRGEVNKAKLQQARDQELEACCEWLDYNCPSVGAHHLRAARRPKPPSLYMQGLRILVENGTNLDGRMELDPKDIETFHAVLERLNQLEDSND